MRRHVRSGLDWLGKAMFSLGRRVYIEPEPEPEPPSLSGLSVVAWNAVEGDRTLRLNYELDESSTVFDVGGFAGHWTSEIFAMYQCRIYVFEPVSSFFERIQFQFRKNTKIDVFPFGLAGADRVDSISLMDNGSSTHISEGAREEVQMRDVAAFCVENEVGQIDLMKINIEGGEFELLDRIISSKLINNVRELQIQFHEFIPDAISRMNLLRGRLSETHFPTYQYDFIWENWKSKES